MKGLTLKKTITLLTLILTLANADFETNFKKSIKELTDIDVQVQFKKELVSFPSSFFVIGKTKGGDIFPVIVNKEGNYFIGLSNVLNLSQADSAMIKEEITKATLVKEEQDTLVLNKLFKSFKKTDFVYLAGNSENLPTKFVITDPDCPYCREHLKNIEKDLEESNLKLIFAPVHDKKAFIKAQLIMQEIAKLPKANTQTKINILRKYYQDFELNNQQLKTDYSQITANTKKIFDSGIVRGVPFIFEER